MTIAAESRSLIMYAHLCFTYARRALSPLNIPAQWQTHAISDGLSKDAGANDVSLSLSLMRHSPSQLYARRFRASERAASQTNASRKYDPVYS